MRYFSNFLEDRKIFYIPLDPVGSSRYPSSSSNQYQLRSTLSSATPIIPTTNTDRDVFANAGLPSSEDLSFAHGNSRYKDTEWTNSGAEIPKTKATTEWQARFGELPLNADGTLNIEEAKFKVSEEFERLYPTYNSGDVGASGGLKLGGYAPGDYVKLPFAEQMRIAEQEKYAERGKYEEDMRLAMERDAAAKEKENPQQNNQLNTILQAGLGAMQMMQKFA
jgi:hypothetical protein